MQPILAVKSDGLTDHAPNKVYIFGLQEQEVLTESIKGVNFARRGHQQQKGRRGALFDQEIA
jgi:hypothetical protein